MLMESLGSVVLQFKSYQSSDTFLQFSLGFVLLSCKTSNCAAMILGVLLRNVLRVCDKPYEKSPLGYRCVWVLQQILFLRESKDLTSHLFYFQVRLISGHNRNIATLADQVFDWELKSS